MKQRFSLVPTLVMWVPTLVMLLVLVFTVSKCYVARREYKKELRAYSNEVDEARINVRAWTKEMHLETDRLQQINGALKDENEAQIRIRAKMKEMHLETERLQQMKGALSDSISVSK